MPRLFQVLRRRRRPLLQTSSLRLHGALANHPEQCSRLPGPRPANDTPVAALHEAMHRDAAAYVDTVGLHLRRGDLPSADALFRATPASACGAYQDAVLLDGYVKAGRLDDARRLFDGMAAKDVVAWTSLVAGYCRAGRVSEARALFDAMPDRNLVSWTAMLHGYARAGMLREAKELFDVMPERNVVTWTVMVKAYADHGHFQEAMELFDRMPQRNSHSWNTMISGFLHAGRVDDAVNLFERMLDRTMVCWTAMVTGLARNGRISMAREFFDRMPQNKDITLWVTMINAYANDGQMSEAERLFDSMPAKNQVSWNILIQGYAKNDRKDKAVGLFLLMLRSAVPPDSTTLVSVLVTSKSTLEVGQIHGMATKIGLLSEIFLGNALLTIYSRSGGLGYAWQAFKMLQEKNVVTWTAMMRSFSNHGRGYCALQAFAQMLRHGHDPDLTTFIAALLACRRAGLFEKGQSIFRSIFAYGLKPTTGHCDLLRRMGHAMEAAEVVAAMPPETRDREMELQKRKKKQKKKAKRKRVEDSRLAKEEPTKGVFGWAVSYLTALVGK